ncbi:hypothetical protein TRVL_06253 [Trypanosoma vivax]|nr:hypothetical protein TRVL_06253 [Trypanosoma vivax]
MERVRGRQKEAEVLWLIEKAAHGGEVFAAQPNLVHGDGSGEMHLTLCCAGEEHCFGKRRSDVGALAKRRWESWQNTGAVERFFGEFGMIRAFCFLGGEEASVGGKINHGG